MVLLKFYNYVTPFSMFLLSDNSFRCRIYKEYSTNVSTLKKNIEILLQKLIQYNLFFGTPSIVAYSSGLGYTHSSMYHTHSKPISPQSDLTIKGDRNGPMNNFPSVVINCSGHLPMGEQTLCILDTYSKEICKHTPLQTLSDIILVLQIVIIKVFFISYL